MRQQHSTLRSPIPDVIQPGSKDAEDVFGQSSSRIAKSHYSPDYFNSKRLKSSAKRFSNDSAPQVANMHLLQFKGMSKCKVCIKRTQNSPWLCLERSSLPRPAWGETYFAVVECWLFHHLKLKNIYDRHINTNESGCLPAEFTTVSRTWAARKSAEKVTLTNPGPATEVCAKRLSLSGIA